MARQRRATTRAIRHDLVGLVDQALVPQRRQAPPHAFDVLRVHGAVRGACVDPKTDALREPLPLVQISLHRLPAAPVELRDAKRLDLGFAADAELLLDLEFDRQTVAIPTALAFDKPPAHGVKAWEDVLEHTRKHVVGAGPAVRRRRSLVEDVRLAARAQLGALCKHLLVTPSRENGLLHADPAPVRSGRDGSPTHAATSRDARTRRTSWKSSNGVNATSRSARCSANPSRANTTSAISDTQRSEMPSPR